MARTEGLASESPERAAASSPRWPASATAPPCGLRIRGPVTRESAGSVAGFMTASPEPHLDVGGSDGSGSDHPHHYDRRRTTTRSSTRTAPTFLGVLPDAPTPASATDRPWSAPPIRRPARNGGARRRRRSGSGGLHRRRGVRGGGVPLEPRLLRRRSPGSAQSVQQFITVPAGQEPPGHPPGAVDRCRDRPGDRTLLSRSSSSRATPPSNRWTAVTGGTPPSQLDAQGNLEMSQAEDDAKTAALTRLGYTVTATAVRGGHLRHLPRHAGLRRAPRGRRGHRGRRGSRPRRRRRLTTDAVPLPLGADRRPSPCSREAPGRRPRCR